jgi:SEC-C motif-containing protein
MEKISPNDSCPCFSNKKYKKCCRPYHNGMNIPTPEALVRARYSAYALGLDDFIMLTTHPESPHYNANKERWRATIKAYILRSRFLRLKILSAEEDKVSYRADIFSVFAGEDNTVIEHCTFKQENGKWLYLDGVHETDKSG